MYKETVYDDDGTVVMEEKYSNFEPAFMFKACAFKLGYKRVETVEE